MLAEKEQLMFEKEEVVKSKESLASNLTSLTEQHAEELRAQREVVERLEADIEQARMEQKQEAEQV